MSVELVIVVKGVNGELVENAKVSVSPGDFTGTTGSNGEATLTVDGADRYQVSVEADGKQQTVPYYAVKGRDSARLEVNLEYFALQEANRQEAVLSSSPTIENSNFSWSATLGGFAFLLVIMVVYILRAKQKKNKKKKPKNKD